MLSVEDIHSYYGESHVLHGVSLTVNKGELVAILGRNGMGKTTLIRSLMGYVKPTEGRIARSSSPTSSATPRSSTRTRAAGCIPIRCASSIRRTRRCRP